MKKTECLERANKARHAAKVAAHRAAMYAHSFGGADPLTQKALMDADVASEVAACWEKFSSLHPKTRAAALRDRKVPEYWFTPY